MIPINEIPYYLQKRIDDIKRLVRTRDQNGSHRGWREECLFQYYNILVQVTSRDDAFKEMEMLNNSLSVPLDKRMLTDIQKEVDKHGFRRYRTDRFYDAMNLTDEECLHVGSAMVRQEAEIRIRKRMAKDIRNALIERLCVEGKSVAEIAEAVDCSQRTVSTVLKNCGCSPVAVRRLTIQHESGLHDARTVKKAFEDGRTESLAGLAYENKKELVGLEAWPISKGLDRLRELRGE